MTSIRSIRKVLLFHGPILLLAALLSPNCAQVSNGEGQDWTCPAEELREGLYSFTVDEVQDGCGVEQLDGSILGRYPPVQLPDFKDLPSQTVIQIPLVGSQDVLLSLNGDTIQISLAGQEEAVLDYGGCELRFQVNGTLCPATVDEIDVEMKFTFVGATELTPGACDILSFEAGCTVIACSRCRRCQ